jgi:hypothetical protein
MSIDLGYHRLAVPDINERRPNSASFPNDDPDLPANRPQVFFAKIASIFRLQDLSKFIDRSGVTKERSPLLSKNRVSSTHQVKDAGKYTT